MTALDALGVSLDVRIALAQANKAGRVGICSFNHVAEAAGLTLDMP